MLHQGFLLMLHQGFLLMQSLLTMTVKTNPSMFGSWQSKRLRRGDMMNRLVDCKGGEMLSVFLEECNHVQQMSRISC